MTVLRAIGLLFLFAFALAAPARADEAALKAIVAKFATAKGFPAIEAVVRELGATGDPAVEKALTALSEGALSVRKADGQVFIVKEAGVEISLFDPITGEAAGQAAKAELTKIKVNNGLRGVIRDVLGTLTLGSADPAVRLAAAENMFRNPDPAAIAALDAAIAKETDAAVKARLEQARASAVLVSDLAEADKLAAIEVLAARGDREALSLLTSFSATTDGALKDAAGKAIAGIDSSLAIWSAGQNVWYGISLGSVLLLAAIGLAITFGVMGVINMAHGEMVMLGAYTTYVVQEAIRNHAPGLFDWSLAIALPLAFLVSAIVGLAIERGIIRFLYGRPLETLLATWGVSLFLQQAVRTMFGPSNRQVGNPSWMSGSFDLGQLSVTWNRLWILVFALAVFAILLFVINRTTLGPADARRHRQSPHGLVDGHPHAVDRCADLRARIGHRRHCRRRAQPDRQCLAQSRPGLHHRQLHGGGVRRRRQSVGHAGRRAVARRPQQVPRALCRRGARQDRRARADHPVHPETPARHVRAQGTGGGSMMSGRFFAAGSDRRVFIMIALLVATAIVVPILSLALPADSALHMPPYMVALTGKYLCYALLALSLDLVWGYCGILSLGHGAFFALGGYAMGMHLMRQIGSRGVYGNPNLPDFMVFLNWKELPWYWYGFDHFWFAALMVMLVPGVLAFGFGWLAFRSRVTGVYLSIITQALTYALLLAFFRNDMGFGGNNGLTDFKDILGFNVQAAGTRAGIVLGKRADAGAGRVRHLEHRVVEIRQAAGRRARRRKPHPLPRLARRERQGVRLHRVGGHGRHCRRALRAAGRHHQSRRVRAGKLDRGGHLDGGRRPRHDRRADRRRRARQHRQILVHRRAARILAVCAGRPVRRRHPVPAQGHRRRLGSVAQFAQRPRGAARSGERPGSSLSRSSGPRRNRRPGRLPKTAPSRSRRSDASS